MAAVDLPGPAKEFLVHVVLELKKAPGERLLLFVQALDPVVRLGKCGPGKHNGCA
jgi:hypothetical protein